MWKTRLKKWKFEKQTVKNVVETVNNVKHFNLFSTIFLTLQVIFIHLLRFYQNEYGNTKSKKSAPS